MTKDRMKINQAGVDAQYELVAQRIKQADSEFRRAHKGQPASELLGPADEALKGAGVNMPQVGLEEYARAVEADLPFEFKLR